MFRIRFWFGYTIYLLFILAFVDYLFYLRYKKNLYSELTVFTEPIRESRETVDVETLDPPTLSRIGFFRPDRSSSFVNFKKEKGERTFRIGCFGDSFTYGAEVEDGFDYPALLNATFKHEGFDRVEVLNFGYQNHGFHQAFILWDTVGGRYDLDAVLLGPQGFSDERDVRFNHTRDRLGWREPAYLHSRYVLAGQGVERIDVIGDSDAERTREYFRFFPHYRYLRYDSQAPPFLACLIPRGRELTVNPFYYYRGDLFEEIIEIRKHLFSEMADREEQILLAHYDFKVTLFGASLQRDNLRVVQPIAPDHFPYTAFRSHNSPAGNQVFARQLFQILTDDTEGGQPLLRTGDVDPEVSTKPLVEKVPPQQNLWVR